MKRVIDGTTVRSYTYTIPQTGVTLEAGLISTLADKVRMHLDANGFQSSEIPRAEIENDWCMRNPSSGSCMEESPAARPLSLTTVINFTKTMLYNYAKGGKRVDQVEADRRGQICSGCEFNVVPGGCAPCLNSGAASAVIGVLVGDRKTSSDSTLNSCAICGCMNKAQVWFPISDLHKGMSESLRNLLPVNCWKK